MKKALLLLAIVPVVVNCVPQDGALEPTPEVTSTPTAQPSAQPVTTPKSLPTAEADKPPKPMFRFCAELTKAYGNHVIVLPKDAWAKVRLSPNYEYAEPRKCILGGRLMLARYFRQKLTAPVFPSPTPTPDSLNLDGVKPQ